MASLTLKRDCKNWIACFTLPGGVRTNRSTGTPDKKLAQKIANDFEEAANMAKKNQFVEAAARRTLNAILRRAGEDSINGDTVEQFLQEWLASKDNKGTNERYGHVVNVFIKHLGSKSKALLSTIGHKDAQSFLASRESEGLASKTLGTDAKILSSAFNLAKRLQFIENNPFEKALAIKPIKIISSKRKAFTPDNVSRLLTKAKGEWATVIMFGYFTGARLEDCVKMKWSNLDLAGRMISYTPQKTGALVTLPMSPQLEEHLQAIASTDSTSPFICPILAGKQSGGKTGLSEAFKKIMVLAGIDPQTIQGQGNRKFSQLSFHSLRHACNTELANNGVDQETRKILVGHATTRINNDYTHLDVEKLRGAVAKLILPVAKVNS